MVLFLLMPQTQHSTLFPYTTLFPILSFCSICQRKGFDHRTDLLQGAKGKRFLGIYRRAGHRSSKRTRAEKRQHQDIRLMEVDFPRRPSQINSMKYRVVIEPDEDGVFV